MQKDENIPSAPPGLFSPGMLVRAPSQPEWGQGQVQSAVGSKVSVNFKNAGKQVVNITITDLLPAYDEWAP